MTTSAVFGYGAKLQISDMAETATFSDVAEIEGLSGPSLSADEIDVTTHDTTDGYREFIQGLKDAGELSVEANFIPTEDTHKESADASLLAAYNSGEKTDFKLVFPDANSTEWAFSAIVTGFEVDIPVDEKMTFSCTLKLSGKPTFNN